MALALVGAGLVGGVGATAANATFNDIPTEGAYTEHITNLQESGIATGYADGSFRPTVTMNRRQTAAWLDRSASRVGVSDLLESDEAPVLDGVNPTATIATVEMTSPAAGDGSGWVSLQGGVGAVAVEGGENCPCTVLLYLRDSEGTLVGRGVVTVIDPEGGLAFATGGVFAVTPIAAGETETFTLDAELVDSDVSVVLAGALYGTYSPLADDATEATQYDDPNAVNTAGEATDPVESVVPELPLGG
jgi:hypothetical protein